MLEIILPLGLLAVIRGGKIAKYTWASFSELIKRTFLIRHRDGGFPESGVT